ncbi:MAG: hypothetical protein K8H88_08775 [Sandaracinaceae bacterium]|nr:hypothetical protein [Sandaracinaceae bacterium]
MPDWLTGTVLKLQEADDLEMHSFGHHEVLDPEPWEKARVLRVHMRQPMPDVGITHG